MAPLPKLPSSKPRSHILTSEIPFRPLRPWREQSDTSFQLWQVYPVVDGIEQGGSPTGNILTQLPEH